MTLTSITLPESLRAIGKNVFHQCPNLTLVIPRNSWLVRWCKDNNLSYTYADALEWLME